MPRSRQPAAQPDLAFSTRFASPKFGALDVLSSVLWSAVVGISTNSLLTLVTLDVKAWASFVSAWHPLNAANELTHSTLPAARGCRCPELYYACRCPGSGRVFLITKSVDAASPPSHRRRCLPVCAVAHVLHMSVCLRRRTRPKQRRCVCVRACKWRGHGRYERGRSRVRGYLARACCIRIDMDCHDLCAIS